MELLLRVERTVPPSAQLVEPTHRNICNSAMAISRDRVCGAIQLQYEHEDLARVWVTPSEEEGWAKVNVYVDKAYEQAVPRALSGMVVAGLVDWLVMMAEAIRDGTRFRQSADPLSDAKRFRKLFVKKTRGRVEKELEGRADAMLDALRKRDKACFIRLLRPRLRADSEGG